MPKRSSGLANCPVSGPMVPWGLTPGLALLLAGCATPQYAIRPTPAPEESAEALEIEREISAVQAEAFEQLGARRLGWNERVRGLDVQGAVDRLSCVTERPALHYRASLYADDDPNAVATRLKTYREQTAPVLSWYEARNGVRRIPATGTVQEIAERVQRSLGR